MIVSALRVLAEPSASCGDELLTKTSFYIACAEVITLDNRRAGNAMSIHELKHIGGCRSKNLVPRESPVWKPLGRVLMAQSW
jgi:hypothetical protein